MSEVAGRGAGTPAAIEGEVVLRAVDVSETCGVTRALQHVDLEVRAGRVTVMSGENGAGEPTLTETLCGVRSSRPEEVHR